ncbi:heterokaryon incompatibility protein-domain-containing protein [Suillus bovinus]|uniref:heterokaryon incompatibility protein-domain-containing protein n=1 Tax=Suillus bovinus TaxID=48563 RepID=UPI001B871AD4|nr:heterokaryon incompatibility protein-domain-containing protein [Suillus bovinus]KAG2142854.1 heterokaryon incompatibility protein-domain-containing protein [Suillus bovinus]
MAAQSIGIQPSSIGYISKGIALCGIGHITRARAAFDVASVYTDQGSETIHFLLLIKAIALFNADQHDEANLLLEELINGCPNTDTRACHIVEAYLRVQLVINALDGGRHDEAADYFTAALNSSHISDIHETYEDLIVLFGWNFKTLWLTAHQKRCQAFLSSGKIDEALESHKSMMNTVNETTEAGCLDWSTALTQECSALFLTNGDTALAASDYDRAIDLYTAAIDLISPSDAVFANRSKAKLGKMLWMEALLDAQKVIQLNPSSHIGYKLKHAALHGAQSYDEAIQAFRVMLSKLDDAPDTETRKLRQQYLNSRMKRIREVVIAYFRYAMLSHRWEGKEPLLQDIQGKVVYQLDPVGTITKLQSFCKTARDLGYRWAWSDTCCIDKSNNVELQESVNSMFVWYHHSALTIVYLSDVPPSSEPGTLAKSTWNTRGWTIQEFLAPNVILFYQKDWTPYLGDCTPNHKDSVAIMQELKDATGIDRQAVVAFRPGMKNAREKLQWASTRHTTLQEDIAYSLSGVFGVRLRVDYGERKQYALGRLLEEIIAQSGDITALDWIGKSSEFNSCLPADITSYKTPLFQLPPPSEDEIQSSVSSLRGVVALQSASELYQTLDYLSAPRFGHRRLHLPCIVFPVTEAKRRPQGHDQDTYTYELKSDGLHNLEITTEDKFTSFSPARPLPSWQTILLVRPWNRELLGLHEAADDTQSDNWSVLESPSYPSHAAQSEPIYSDSHLRQLQMIVRLGQPFHAFLLARQRDGEFKRIASDLDIIAQVKDMASINYLMDIRTLEVL